MIIKKSFIKVMLNNTPKTLTKQQKFREKQQQQKQRKVHRKR